jgi:hypothetical protein
MPNLDPASRLNEVEHKQDLKLGIDAHFSTCEGRVPIKLGITLILIRFFPCFILSMTRGGVI